VYDFLNPEDDLKKVKERIDDVKEQIANGDAPWSEIRSPRSVRKRNRKNPGIRGALRESSNRKIINGEMEKTPEIVLDDLLMLADWKLKHKDYKTAGTNYYLASLIATGKFANLEYDGTTTRNVAIIGMKMSKFQISNFQFQADNSFRSAELTLKLYLSTTNDEQRAEYDTGAAMKILPIANPFYLRYKIYEIKKDVLPDNYTNILNHIKLINDCTKIPLSVYRILLAAYIINGENSNAFNVAIKALLKTNNEFIEGELLYFCRNNYACASKADLEIFDKIYRSHVLKNFAIYNRTYNIKNYKRWEMFDYPNELKIRELIRDAKYKELLDFFKTYPFANQFEHFFYKSLGEAAIGNTNAAYKSMDICITKRQKVLRELLRKTYRMNTSREKKYLDLYITNTNENNEK